MNLVFILVLSKIYVALAHILTRWGEWPRLSAGSGPSQPCCPADHRVLKSELAQMGCEPHPQL